MLKAGIYDRCAHFEILTFGVCLLNAKGYWLKYLTFRNVDFGELLSDEAKKRHKYTHYDMLSNIVHDGEPKSGVYLAHVLHKVSEIIWVWWWRICYWKSEAYRGWMILYWHRIWILRYVNWVDVVLTSLVVNVGIHTLVMFVCIWRGVSLVSPAVFSSHYRHSGKLLNINWALLIRRVITLHFLTVNFDWPCMIAQFSLQCRDKICWMLFCCLIATNYSHCHHIINSSLACSLVMKLPLHTCS